uniref:Cel12E n=1 Tax=Unknown prokaryotic organism TaxID=2725 RepID=A0A0F7YYA5_UNKP|nr:Cel12E [unidentified prokaryotic organism]
MKSIALGVSILMILAVVSTFSVSAQETTVLEFPGTQGSTALIDMNGDGISDFIMEINPWNIQDAQGKQIMEYDPNNNEIRFSSNLTDIVPKNSDRWIYGYPEVYFGSKPWNSKVAGGLLKLPKKVSDLSGFTLKFEYSLEHDPNLPINLAMETWLTTDQLATSGVKAGDIEIMVWLYSSKLNPAGRKIDTVTVPMIVNGRLVNESFEVWKMEGMGSGWTYFAFRLTTPLKSAEIGIDPTLFIKKVEGYIQTNVENLYMQDWEIGTEFGNPTTTSALFNWTIRNLEVNEEALLPSSTSSPEQNQTSPSNTTNLIKPGSLDVKVNSWGSATQYSCTLYLGAQYDWSVKVELKDGSEITSYWSADATEENGTVVFTPKSWNRGPTASFGFIASGDVPVESITLIVDGKVWDVWPNEAQANTTSSNQTSTQNATATNQTTNTTSTNTTSNSNQTSTDQTNTTNTTSDTLKPGSLSVSINDWGTGGQFNINLDLGGQYEWVVKVKVESPTTIGNYWSAQKSEENGWIIFTPTNWNKGPTASFGFIVNGPVTGVKQIILEVNGELWDIWTPQ